jgi:hypothetical protein
MEKHTIVAKLYSYFYGKYFHTTHAVRERDYSICKNFINAYSKNHNDIVGFNFLFNYVAFQFNKCYYKKFKKIFPGYIFGSNAIKDWDNKPATWEYSIKKGFLKSREIIKSNVINEVIDEEIDEERFLEINLNEEIWKEKTKDEQRLFICLQYTTMWHPNSKWCKECKVKKECKINMKKTYPRIHKVRQNAINPTIFKRAYKVKQY